MDIQVGDKAPNFTLQDTNGEKRELYELIDGQKAVLLFFPLAFSSVCTNELCTIRDNMKLYNSLDAVIIGISIDSFFTLKEFRKSNNLNFPLLSDFNKEVAKTYGVLYEDYFGMKGVSKRATFVIGQDKHISYTEVLEDSGDLPDFKAIQEALD
jgi:peroxiredoxin